MKIFSLQIVRHQDPCNTAKVVEGINVGIYPAFHVPGQESFYIGILAPGENGNKNVCWNSC
jgi:hypothetical protein